MGVVKISRYTYISNIFVIIVTIFTAFLSFFEDLPFISIISVIVFTILIHELLNYQRYRLELLPDRLKEYHRNTMREVVFKDIELLDCESIGIRIFPRCYPRFKFILNDGSNFYFTTSSPASLYDINVWIIRYYPNVKISESAYSLLNGGFGKFF